MFPKVGNKVVTSWTYEGDIETATLWLPFAQGMLQTWARNGVHVNNCNPAEGIEIRIDTVTGRIHIKADTLAGIYMECGIAEVYGFTQLANDAYRPATIHYTSEVENEYSQPGSLFGYTQLNNKLSTPPQSYRFTISGDRKANENRYFNGYGHDNNLKSISLGCLEKYRINSDNALVCQVAPNLLDKKHLAVRHPSSLYQGKMQLYIQALYGSTRMDLRLEPYLHWKVPLLNLPVWPKNNEDTPLPMTLNPYKVAYGIYTTTDNRYYLVELNTRQMAFHPLIPDSIGSAWVERLKKDKQNLSEDEIIKIECLILSTCKPGQFTKTINFINSIQYDSFFYSWRLNWNCTEGLYVGHSIESDVKLMRSHPYQIKINITSQFYSSYAAANSAASENAMIHELSNQFVVDAIDVKISEKDGGDYWKVYAHTTWVPDFSTGGSMVFAAPWQPAEDGEPGTYNALVYGYYEDYGENSVLKEIHYISNTTLESATSHSTVWDGEAWGSNCIQRIAGKDSYSSAGGRIGSYSVSIGEKQLIAELYPSRTGSEQYYDFNDMSLYGEGYTFYTSLGDEQVITWSAASGWRINGFLNQISEACDDVGASGYNYRYHNTRTYLGYKAYRFHGYMNYVSYTSKQKTGQFFILIPYWDCAAVFVCSSVLSQHSGTTNNYAEGVASVATLYNIVTCQMGYPDPLPFPLLGPNILGLSDNVVNSAERPITINGIDGNGFNILYGGNQGNVYTSSENRWEINVEYGGANIEPLSVYLNNSTLPDWVSIFNNPRSIDVQGSTLLFATSKRSIHSQVKTEFVTTDIVYNNEYEYQSSVGWV